ncbi:AAEL011073-PC, partial [Aedes aegypti]
MAVSTWFRNLIKPKNFIEAQRPVLALTFIGGMTPFRLVKQNNQTILQCSTFGYANSFIHTTIFILCYGIAIYKSESVTGYFIRSDISNLGDILQAATGIGALVMTFFYSIFQRHRLIEAFYSLALTDQHFNEIGIEIDYQKSLVRNYTIVLLQLLVLATYTATSSTIVLSSGYSLCLAAWITFLLPFVMMSMIIILYFSLVDQCKHRFNLLNKMLEQLRMKTVQKQLLRYSDKHIAEVPMFQKPFAVTMVFPVSVTEIVNHLASIQSDLCDACESIEDHFTLQMLTVVAISFLISVFDLYYISEKIFTDGATSTHVNKFQFVAFFFYQGLVHVIAVMKIVYIASMAIRENKQIAVNVHKLINVNNYDDELTKQLTNLSLQMTHRKVAFTAYGFFKLDFTLLFTLVGAATTYLVILVQFSLNQSQPCNQSMINYVTTPANTTLSP